MSSKLCQNDPAVLGGGLNVYLGEELETGHCAGWGQEYERNRWWGTSKYMRVNAGGRGDRYIEVTSGGEKYMREAEGECQIYRGLLEGRVNGSTAGEIYGDNAGGDTNIWVHCWRVIYMEAKGIPEFLWVDTIRESLLEGYQYEDFLLQGLLYGNALPGDRHRKGVTLILIWSSA